MSIDLNKRLAARAARDEALNEPHVVELGEDTFEVPRMANWPVDVIDALTSGLIVEGVRLVLGEDWDRFNSHRPTVGVIEELFEGIAEAEGVESVGNSSASSASSRKNGKPSRPTSRAGTRST